MEFVHEDAELRAADVERPAPWALDRLDQVGACFGMGCRGAAEGAGIGGQGARELRRRACCRARGAAAVACKG